MAFLVGGANSATSGAYDIENSLRFGGDNHHLSMIYGSAASDANRRTWTFSSWIKLGQAAHYSLAYPNEKYILTSTDAAVSTTHIGYGYTAGDFFLGDGRSGTYIYTSAKFRDPSAWYHLCIKYDSTQSTASDRIFIYVNGVAQSLNYSNTGDPEVDLNTAVDFFLAGDDVDVTSADSGNFVHNVNSYYNSGFGASNNEFDGYIADFYLLDGQALAPTEFAETNDDGVWIPKKYGGTFNAHSFKLEFQQTGSSADASGIGADTSGQDNHFKVGVNSTLAATDITTDTPTNNFCTLNPLLANTQIGFSEGNCKMSSVPASDTNYLGAWSSIGVTKGKWYAEFKIESAIYSSLGTDATTLIGVGSGNYKAGNENHNVAIGGYAHWWLDHTDKRVVADGDVDATGIATIAQNEIVGCMLNADEGKVWFQQNGVTRGASGGYPFNATVSSGQGFQHFIPVVREVDGSIYGIINCNFGNPTFAISSGNADANGYGNFEYAVPSGYYALCTKNLATYG